MASKLSATPPHHVISYRFLGRGKYHLHLPPFCRQGNIRICFPKPQELTVDFTAVLLDKVAPPVYLSALQDRLDFPTKVPGFWCGGWRHSSFPLRAQRLCCVCGDEVFHMSVPFFFFFSWPLWTVCFAVGLQRGRQSSLLGAL